MTTEARADAEAIPPGRRAAQLLNQKISSLNISVTPLTAETLVDTISDAVTRDERLVVLGHNLHSAYLAQVDPHFRKFYDDADVTVVDGRPVLALLNWERRRRGAKTYKGSFRVGSTDWITMAVKDPAITRVCVLGASTASNEGLIARLQEQSIDVEYIGIPGDPWLWSDLDAVTGAISEFAPQLTLVGMGMPLQEAVCRQLISAGLTGVAAVVGGAIDQLSGRQALAPRWTGQLGMEWLWRLASDPRRLAHRYLIEPLLLARLLMQGRRTR